MRKLHTIDEFCTHEGYNSYDLKERVLITMSETMPISSSVNVLSIDPSKMVPISGTIAVVNVQPITGSSSPPVVFVHSIVPPVPKPVKNVVTTSKPQPQPRIESINWTGGNAFRVRVKSNGKNAANTLECSLVQLPNGKFNVQVK